MANLSDILTARTSQGPSDNFKNLIINGAMQVAQRGTSTASITTSNYYTLDRFAFRLTTAGTWTSTQENDAPTGSGFRKSSKMLCTTADASPAAGDSFAYTTILEGQNLQQIKKGTAAAEQLTLSFWVKANVTGTYIVQLTDYDNSRSVSKSYTINASGTWEKEVITFPADTTGVFDNDNAASFGVDFWLVAGSNYTSGTLQTTWSSTTNANAAVGQVNLASATSNYWQITGVQLEVGDTATPFEFKPFAQDLEECKRYYRKSFPYATAPESSYTTTKMEIQGARHQVSDSLGFRSQVVFFDTEMRADPTLTLFNGSTNSSTTVRLFTNSGTTQDIALSVYNPNPYSFYLARYDGVSVGSTGLSIQAIFNYTASSEL